MFRKAARPTTPSVSFGEVSVAEAAACEKLLKLKVKPEAIQPIRAAVLAEFQREATLPGFRKGKAPVDLVERQYGSSIREETLHRVTKTTLEQATEAYALKPVGPFEIRSANLNDDGLTFEATVEVEPVFDLAAYKGLSVPPAANGVTPEEMEQALKSLQDSSAQLVPAKEGEAKERQVPALDDELAKDLGFKDLVGLKEHVAGKLREQKQQAQEKAREAAICDALLNRHSFEVPPRLVSHQTDRLTRDFTVRLLLSGMPQEKADEEVKQFTEKLRESAQKQVKLLFILGRIAEKESVAVTQQELVERLWQLSQRWKKEPSEVRQILDAQGLWSSVVSAIRQEKTMAVLLGSAEIKNSQGATAGGALHES